LAGWALWVWVLRTTGVCTGRLLDSVRPLEPVTVGAAIDRAPNCHLLIGL
jgi:hypothetical protein